MVKLTRNLDHSGPGLVTGRAGEEFRHESDHDDPSVIFL